MQRSVSWALWTRSRLWAALSSAVWSALGSFVVCWASSSSSSSALPSLLHALCAALCAAALSLTATTSVSSSSSLLRSLCCVLCLLSLSLCAVWASLPQRPVVTALVTHRALCAALLSSLLSALLQWPSLLLPLPSPPLSSPLLRLSARASAARALFPLLFRAALSALVSCTAALLLLRRLIPFLPQLPLRLAADVSFAPAVAAAFVSAFSLLFAALCARLSHARPLPLPLPSPHAPAAHALLASHVLCSLDASASPQQQYMVLQQLLPAAEPRSALGRATAQTLFRHTFAVDVQLRKREDGPGYVVFVGERGVAVEQGPSVTNLSCWGALLQTMVEQLREFEQSVLIAHVSALLASGAPVPQSLAPLAARVPVSSWALLWRLLGYRNPAYLRAVLFRDHWRHAATIRVLAGFSCQALRSDVYGVCSAVSTPERVLACLVDLYASLFLYAQSLDAPVRSSAYVQKDGQMLAKVGREWEGIRSNEAAAGSFGHAVQPGTKQFTPRLPMVLMLECKAAIYRLVNVYRPYLSELKISTNNLSLLQAFANFAV